MLPILVSRELLEGLKEFLRATFPVTTPGFLREDGRSFVDDFLRTDGGLCKGPWLEDGLRALMARDRAVENWLRQEVGSAHDALKADPARAVTVDKVRAALAAEHKKATAKA